jgi:hypothetical protein
LTSRRAELGAAALLAALAAVSLAAPELLAARFSPDLAVPLEDFKPAALAVSRVLWGPLAAGAFVLAMRARGDGAHPWSRWESTLLLAAAVFAYLVWSLPVHGWLVDDAGITFAYARNLAEGHGLTIAPGHVPEEGYSDTSWLLLLAAAHKLGAGIPATAKSLGLGCGVLALLLSLGASIRVRQESLSAEEALVGMLVALGAPFLVWSASGLEHGLQAALLALVVASPLLSARPERIAGAAFAVLALTRPETPLLLGCAGLVFLVQLARERDPQLIARAALFGVPAGVVFAALLLFRWLYFGDLQPNPYYAKADTASPAALLNLLGGGWPYVSGWAASSGAALLLPQLALAFGRAMPLSGQLAFALLAGQLAFVVGVRGDWMGEYRFVAPLLPVLSHAVLWSSGVLGERVGPNRVRRLSALTALVLFVAATVSYTRFVAAPTTPFEIVGRIGQEFAALGERLGVAHVSLAHHDAGGTNYTAHLDLIDLGGLTDRGLAKHMRDREWVLAYLLGEKQPTFVYGSALTFAAGRTRFFEDQAFRRAYVPLEFAGRPFMRADLCFVRRDVLRPIPGLHVVPEGSTGESVERVRVDP